MKKKVFMKNHFLYVIHKRENSLSKLALLSIPFFSLALLSSCVSDFVNDGFLGSMGHKIGLSASVPLSSQPNTEYPWRDAKHTKEDMTTEEMDNFLIENDRKFFMPIPRAIKGFKISAMEKSLNSFVSLRHFGDQVDFEVTIVKSLCADSGTIYLKLLDEDQFLIRSIYVGAVAKNFTGEILSNFKMDWDDFKTIKYYRLEMMVNVK
jgi:hypothetical protein